MSHSRRKVDLTGQTFTYLTVLRPGPNKDGRTTWVCQCKCGNIKLAKTYHLQNGHTKSCGCLKRQVDCNAKEMSEVVSLGTLMSDTIRSNNTSGVTGVCWSRTKRMWRADICYKGNRIFLGYHHQFKDAVNARQQYEDKLKNQVLFNNTAI